MKLPLVYSQALVRGELTDTAQVLRKSYVADAAGGQTETETVVATLPCLLQPERTTPLERPEGGRVVAITLWTCLFAAGTDIRPTDVLLINGERYEPVDDDAARSNEVDVAVSVRRVG